MTASALNEISFGLSPGGSVTLKHLHSPSEAADAATKSYSDTQDASTLAAAKAYTDASVGGGGIARTVVNVSSYTILGTDMIVAVTCTPTTAVSLTLPAAASAEARTYTIVDEGGAAQKNHITISCFAGDTICGATQVIIRSNYNSLTLYHDTTSAWFIL